MNLHTLLFIFVVQVAFSSEIKILNLRGEPVLVVEKETCPMKQAVQTIRNEREDVSGIRLIYQDGREVQPGELLSSEQSYTVIFDRHMVLTASEEEMSEVSLLRFGADDYMTKPVRGHVLLARIEALLRRKEGRVLRALKPEYVSHNTPSNAFHIDEINKTVNCQGHNLQLTAAQFEIFQILMENTENSRKKT